VEEDSSEKHHKSDLPPSTFIDFFYVACPSFFGGRILSYAFGFSGKMSLKVRLVLDTINESKNRTSLLKSKILLMHQN
jgi:hypothetical protein